MLPQINSRIRQIDDYLQKHIPTANQTETQSYLCKLGAVMVCGFIERSVEILLLNKLQSRAQPQVLNFIKSHFKKGTNYDCEAICQLLIRFDRNWYHNFKNYVESNSDVVDGIVSCYNIRNSVAHGLGTGIGFQALQEYANSSKKIVQALSDAIDH